MASLYKNRGTWYLAVCIKGKRINKSLGTKDKTVAKRLKPFVETSILQEVKGFIESRA